MDFIMTLGLLAAIAFLILGAYKGLHVFPLTLLAVLIVILTNNLDIWDGYNIYANSFGGTANNYLLLFASCAIYAKCMDITGAAMKIGHVMIDRFGSSRAMIIVFLINSALTLGGISVFVVIFVIAPIAFAVYKKAGLARHLIVPAVYAGMSTYTMTCVPGTPAIQNVIPTNYISTSLTAAPILGLICSAAFIVTEICYMKYAEKKSHAANETFSFPENFNASAYEINPEMLPPAYTAFIPLLSCFGIIICANILKFPIAENSTKLCCMSMVISSILALILNLNYIRNDSVSSKFTIIKNGLGEAALNAIGAYAGLAALTGFGTVVASTSTFENIIQWLISVPLSPYWKGVFSTSMISGIAASGSVGIRLTYEYLADYFLTCGCDLSILHRLTAIACGSLDTLPHVAGLAVVFNVLGLTHKEAYRHVFWTTVLIPSIIVVIATASITLLGL